MANSLKRNRSRRRIAAVTFLSNISLDGSYRDTKLALLPRNGALTKNEFALLSKTDEVLAEESDIQEDCFSDYEGVPPRNTLKSKDTKKRFYKSRTSNVDGHSLSSESDSVLTPIKTYLDEATTVKNVLTSGYPHRERTSTSMSEPGVQEKKAVTGYRKRVMQQGSVCSDSERQQFGSSSESIGPVTVRNKTSPAPPAVIPEVNGEKEVKFVKSIQNHKFKGERIVMVTNKHSPFLICSFIPYIRNHKARSDIRKDVTRKRHISGSRPLSSVGDGFDPFEMLGIEKGPEGQEVSYGKLLVPTRSIKEFRERRHNTYDDCLELLPSHIPGRPRHVVARTKVLTRQPGYKW